MRPTCITRHPHSGEPQMGITSGACQPGASPARAGHARFDAADVHHQTPLLPRAADVHHVGVGAPEPADTQTHREAARRPHARAASGDLFTYSVVRYSVVLRLFFCCSSVRAFGGPPSGKSCRLRRRPASRRRIDAPPVDGLCVRRSVSC